MGATLALAILSFGVMPHVTGHRFLVKSSTQTGVATGRVDEPQGSTIAVKPRNKLDLGPLPPLAPIAGLNGFEAVSTLTSSDLLEPAHRLVASYVFPDRVSLSLSVKQDRLTERQIHLRYGEHVFIMRLRSSLSEELKNAERADVLRQMELRRALMLWPDGFDWKGSSSEQQVDLGSMGSLRARFASGIEKRPTEIASLDASGETIDAFRDLTWRVDKGRAWPDTAQYWVSTRLLWIEKLESIDTGKTFIDNFFLPTDLRDSRIAHDVMVGRVQSLDLPSFCGRRFGFAKDVTWEAALFELEGRRAEWKARLESIGLYLDPKTMIEISNDGLPIACILRLTKIPDKLPEGFSVTPVRTSRAMYVNGRSEAKPECLRTLAEALPAGSRTQVPYIRFDEAEQPKGLVLIVVPLALPE